MNEGSGGSSEFFASDSAGKGDVSWEEGDSLGVGGAEVGIFEEVDHSCFTCLLESEQG